MRYNENRKDVTVRIVCINDHVIEYRDVRPIQGEDGAYELKTNRLYYFVREGRNATYTQYRYCDGESLRPLVGYFMSGVLDTERVKKALEPGQGESQRVYFLRTPCASTPDAMRRYDAALASDGGGRLVSARTSEGASAMIPRSIAYSGDQDAIDDYIENLAARMGVTP